MNQRVTLAFKALAKVIQPLEHEYTSTGQKGLKEQMPMKKDDCTRDVKKSLGDLGFEVGQLQQHIPSLAFKALAKVINPLEYEFADAAVSIHGLEFKCMKDIEDAIRVAGDGPIKPDGAKSPATTSFASRTSRKLPCSIGGVISSNSSRTALLNGLSIAYSTPDSSGEPYKFLQNAVGGVFNKWCCKCQPVEARACQVRDGVLQKTAR